jgi:ligand-binding sensor domain-containing protein/AraC-like DNA-binding protein
MPMGKSSPPITHQIVKAFFILLIVASPSLRGDTAGSLFPVSSSELKIEYDRWVRRTWTTADGLPQNTVYALAQSVDGCLWIGSEGGLARFDGAAFTVFRKSTTLGLASDSITSLSPLADGSLWVGTYGGGLVRLRNGQFTRIAGLAGDGIWSLHRDSAGALWVVPLAGPVFCLEPGRAPAQAIIGDLPDSQVTAVAGDEKGTLWIGTRAGLAAFRSGRQTVFHPRDGLAGDYVYCLFSDSRSRLWVGTTTGLSRIDASGVRSFSTADGLANNMVRAIGEDAAGRIWIGGDKGVTIMTPGEKALFAAPDSLAGDAVMAICRDREDGMWVGWAASGLSCFRRNEVLVHGTKEGMSSRQVTSVCEDVAGRIWAGTRDVGLNRMENGKWRFYSTRDGLASNAITAILPVRDERLWIGTLDAGLQVMAGGMRFMAPPPGGPAKEAILSLHSLDGRDLWGGCNGSGLYELNDGIWRHHGAANGLQATVITALGHDSRRTLWAGSSGEGLFSYSWQSRSWRKAPVDQLNGETVFSISPAVGRGLWLGTSAGLVLLRGNELHRFDRGPEPLRQTILQIIEDFHGWLWMSTPSGIIRAKRAALEAAAPLGGLGLHCRQFGEMSGMLSTACTGGFQPTGWLGEAGRLYFPTQNGLAVIDSHTLTSGPPPIPRLASTVADGVTVHGGQALPAGNRRIDFSFAATSFADPRQIEFSSRLDGLDRDWSAPFAEGKKSVSGLGAGTYAFRVRARGLSGTWSKEAGPFTFSIRPHFLQTAPFYLLLLAGISASAVGTFFYRQQKTRRQRLEKYKSSGLSSDRTREYGLLLEKTMEQERLYLDPDLTLAKLADATAIPAKPLSQVINERFGMNFNDYVNRLRVEEAKRLLLDPATGDFKLLRVAFASGFNSKSVFNAAFKKHTGLSPSEFRRLLGTV